MHFELSDSEIAIQKLAREFSEKELRPGATARDMAAEFPYDGFRHAAELGFTGIPFSPEYGGSGASWLSFILAIEEVSRIDPALGVTLAVTGGVTRILDSAGTEEQKRKWMEPLVRGTHIGAFGLTESAGGSDNQAMGTTADLVNGEWVINGSKEFITNSGTDISLFSIVFCVTGQRPDGRKEFSAILVPNGTPGFKVLPSYRKLGWRSSDTHPLAFDDCRVPENHLISERGTGLRTALGVMLEFGRVVIAASALGLAQGCLDECIRYVSDRSAFGRPIGAFQAIQHRIADMATEIEASRLMVYQATRAQEANSLTAKDAAMVKLFVTEMAQRTAVAACEIFGGMGFMDETPVARFYRDVKVMTIGEGTSNIQRMVISRQLGLPQG